MEKEKHTLPWVRGHKAYNSMGYTIEIDCGVHNVCTVECYEGDETNLNEIIASHNSHYKLVAVLEEILAWYGGMVAGGVEDQAREAVERAKAALAAAEKGGE